MPWNTFGLICDIYEKIVMIINSEILVFSQIHLLLTDSPSVKCVIKKLFGFLFEFNELNSNEKQKRFLMTHLMNGPYIMGR